VTVVLAGTLGGCDAVRPTVDPTSPTGTAIATTASASGATVPPTTTGPDATVDCAITQAPAAGDEPPRDGSDLIDTGDFGGGRWHLCLAGPIQAAAEKSAWCVWNPARSAVTEIDGLPVPIGGIEFGANLSFDRADFNLGLTQRATGNVATYTAEGGSAGVNASDDRTTGTAAFDVVLMVDPEAAAPAGFPPRIAGSMRWTCGGAPPTR
jgi:hypothetical protein